MFTILKQKILLNKSFFTKIVIFLGIYFLFSELSFANEGVEGVKGIDELKSKVIEVASYITTFMSLILGLLTYLVTMFLSPEWTNGSLFGITDKLKQIWIFISNFVYLVFAFLLIFIAFMNIIGNQNYEFKTSLKKFIIGILIVPFSWFFVNFIVSLSSVLFAGAMTLPNDTFPNYNETLQKVYVPKQCTLDFSVLTGSSGNSGSSGSSGSSGTSGTSGSSGSSLNDKKIFKCDGLDDKNKRKEDNDKLISLGNLLQNGDASSGVFGVMSTYSYGILGIEKFDTIKIDENVEKSITNIGDIVVYIVFNLLFIIIYGLLMIALGLALMIRGIRLWIFMMFSPLFGLMYFFGDKMNKGFFEKFSIGQFISLALVPVYSMLALSFGLLFIWLTGTGLAGNNHSVDNTFRIEKDNLVIGSKEENSVSLEIKGAIGNNFKELNFLGSEVIGGTLGIIGTLILKIFGIVVLWGTVMAALRSSEITKTIVEPIAQFGDSVKNLAKNIPQYTPILPGGGTLSSLKQIPNSLDATLSNKSSRAGAEMAKKLGFADDSIDALNDLSESIKNVKASNFTPDSKLKSYDELLKYIKNNPNDLNSDRFKTLYTDFQKNIVKNEKFDIKGLGGTINLEKISKNLYETVESKDPKKIFGPTYEIKARNEADFLKILSAGVTPPSAQVNTTATNIADSSVKTVDNKTVNGTDNNGQVNQGGNNGQNTQNPPANP